MPFVKNIIYHIQEWNGYPLELDTLKQNWNIWWHST